MQPPCVGWEAAGDLQEDLIRAGAALAAPEGGRRQKRKRGSRRRKKRRTSRRRSRRRTKKRRMRRRRRSNHLGR